MIFFLGTKSAILDDVFTTMIMHHSGGEMPADNQRLQPNVDQFEHPRTEKGLAGPSTVTVTGTSKCLEHDNMLQFSENATATTFNTAVPTCLVHDKSWVTRN